MANRQARRRKVTTPKVTRTVVQLPRDVVKRVGMTIGFASIVVLIAVVTRSSLNVPIEKLTIDAPFQRVSAMQVREAIGSSIDRGFIGVSLKDIRQNIDALAWVDRSSVRRVWPNELQVSLIEQVPAAQWGESGLLNTRGELFVESSRHELPELPRLSGPDSRLHDVASQYLALRGALIEAGLGLRGVSMDARGAWQLVLGNGIDVRLGREDAAARAKRFVEVAAPVVTRHESKIRFVDMRYSNGFSIGWKKDEYRQQVRLEAAAATSVMTQGTKE
ncbi:MAG: cell division protein FtsQ/DivIB [Woeseiaceae bacterium]